MKITKISFYKSTDSVEFNSNSLHYILLRPKY